MGTPEFAIPSLEILNKKYEVVGLFTKIDKINTRGGKIKFSPVKEYGLRNNIPVYQPQNLKSDECYSLIEKLKPDLIVVVAYGKIIPNNIIAYPKYGIINVHSSILPKYRGAAPINAAIVAGENETGVTIMDIVEELDAGAIIDVEKTSIYKEDNFLTLHDRLKELGAIALERAVDKIFNSQEVRVEQKHSEATFVKPYKKDDCRINWSKSSREIFNFVRGMTPHPGVFTTIDGKIIKIIEVEELDETYSEYKTGEIVGVKKNQGFIIKTGDKALILVKIKPENKGIISGKDAINGKHLPIGGILE